MMNKVTPATKYHGHPDDEILQQALKDAMTAEAAAGVAMRAGNRARYDLERIKAANAWDIYFGRLGVITQPIFIKISCNSGQAAAAIKQVADGINGMRMAARAMMKNMGENALPARDHSG